MSKIDVLMNREVDNTLANENFAAYCLRMVGNPYWYGCVGARATKSLMTRKAKQYPAHYGSSRTARYERDIANHAVVADCIGGAKAAAWSGPRTLVDALGKTGAIASRYGANGCPDKSANGMFSYAKSRGMDWGTIDTLPEIVGLALHKDGHVGYYVGDGYAVEWRGFSYGCVKTRVSARGWKYWYKLPFIDYGEGTADGSTDACALGSRLLKKGMVGSDVKALQELLMQLGFDLPKYGTDADFGAETEKAVIAFQKKAGIKADGKYGAETHEALMDAVADDDEGKKEDEPEESTPETDAPAEPKPVGTTVVIVAEGGGKVNIRVGNDTGYKRITTVPAGTTFEWVAAAANGWNAVAVGGQVGWVSGKYSRKV